MMSEMIEIDNQIFDYIFKIKELNNKFNFESGWVLDRYRLDKSNANNVRVSKNILETIE